MAYVQCMTYMPWSRDSTNIQAGEALLVSYAIKSPPSVVIATANGSMLSGIALSTLAFLELDEIKSQPLEEKKEVESELTIATLGWCK